MFKRKFAKKAVELSVLFGIICSVFVSLADFDGACEELRNNVLRLHIVANSDSEYDQQLKLDIRDEILKQSGELFGETDDLAEAIKKAEDSLENIENTALEVIKAKGYDYSVKVSVADSFFETREYEDFTLPAGVYKALKVEIGQSAGRNWWCVIFPQVCLPAAGDAKLSDSVSSETAKVAENPQKYVIRFKSIEIYENIKKVLKSDS